MSKRRIEKDDWLATTLNGVHYICFPLHFNVYKSRTIISRFSKRWMICNYDVECILTTLNDLYYVEWFVLTWKFCTCNVECFLTMLKDLHCCWMIWWFGGFNETSFWKISSRKLSRNLLSHENPNNEHCPLKKPPLWKLLR